MFARSAAPASPPDPSPVVTLLTDFGLDDVYVGVLHGVIARHCPTARVIDISHGVPRGDILAGALALADAIGYVPVGVHVAVVDPGVGSAREALALACSDGRILVGPDNGLLWLAAQRCGGIASAVAIGASPYRLATVSATFHGRDVFAPVAAALAGGEALDAVGESRGPEGLVTLELPSAVVSGAGFAATVTAIDGFGNLALAAWPRDATAAGLAVGDLIWVSSDAGQPVPARYGRTFSDVGARRLLLLEDSTGRLGLAVNGGSAAARLGVAPGATVRVAGERN